MTAPILTTWGGGLTEADYASLAGRWITRELADQSGIRRVDSIPACRCRPEARQPGRPHHPQYGAVGSHPRNYRLRLDSPDLQYRSDGTVREANKYLQPPEARNTTFFPVGVPEAALADTTLPAIVTRGRIQSDSAMAAGDPGCSFASFFAGVLQWRLELARHSRQTSRTKWRPARREGRYSGRRSHHMERPPRGDRLRC